MDNAARCKCGKLLIGDERKCIRCSIENKEKWIRRGKAAFIFVMAVGGALVSVDKTKGNDETKTPLS